MRPPSLSKALEGLDDVPDDALVVDSSAAALTLTIASVGGKKRRFAVSNLQEEIDGVRRGVFSPMGCQGRRSSSEQQTDGVEGPASRVVSRTDSHIVEMYTTC